MSLYTTVCNWLLGIVTRKKSLLTMTLFKKCNHAKVMFAKGIFVWIIVTINIPGTTLCGKSIPHVTFS